VGSPKSESNVALPFVHFQMSASFVSGILSFTTRMDLPRPGWRQPDCGVVPQITWHCALQLAPGEWSSHCSPHDDSTVPLPHVIGLPWQIPATHWSESVHELPSVHPVPFGFGGLEHTPV